MKKIRIRIKGRKLFAAGNYDLLEENANREEKKKGWFTRVTSLSLDETDPS